VLEREGNGMGYVSAYKGSPLFEKHGQQMDGLEGGGKFLGGYVFIASSISNRWALRMHD